MALVLVRHPAGLSRAEVGVVLRRRWPRVWIGDVGDAMPSWPMPLAEMAELARARRGAEPLRVLVLAQQLASHNLLRGAAERRTATIGPMPVVV